MVVDIILLSIGIIGLIIATYSDVKTTEIPDWISFSLIISGLSLRLLYSLTNQDFSFITIALLNLVIFFIIGNVMYYSRQWGGGDAKLLMAISVIFATYPKDLLKIFSPNLNSLNFPFIIFINILIIGAIYSIIYTIYLAIKHKKEFTKEFRLYLQKTKQARKIFLILSILLIILALMFENFFTKITLFISSITILFFLYFWIYIKSVEKGAMYKKTPTSKLIEGDWITKNIYKNKKLLLKIPRYGITKKQINLLKKHGIKSIEVKQGIVFTPSFLIATIISLIFGNLIPF